MNKSAEFSIKKSVNIIGVMSHSDPGKYANNEDDYLVDRFKKGERAAFDELYHRYKNSIFNYLKTVLGKREIAEELTQEVFISLYLNIASYRPMGMFKSWIYMIARNMAKNELKKMSYRFHVSLSKPIGETEEDIAMEDVLTKKELSPDYILKNKELKERIESAVRSLPVLHREVIVLCVIEGLSYEEAARVLNTNVKTVSSRLARAREIFIREWKI